MRVRRSIGARTSLPSLPRTLVAGLLETTESTSDRAEPFRPVAGKAFASAPFGPAHVVAEPRPQLPVCHAQSVGSILRRSSERSGGATDAMSPFSFNRCSAWYSVPVLGSSRPPDCSYTSFPIAYPSEEAVQPGEAHSRPARALHHAELVPQREQLDVQSGTCAQRIADGLDERKEDRHGSKRIEEPRQHQHRQQVRRSR